MQLDFMVTPVGRDRTAEKICIKTIEGKKDHLLSTKTCKKKYAYFPEECIPNFL